MATIGSKALDEFIELCLSAPTNQQIAEFRPSEEVHKYLLELRHASNEGQLTQEQEVEFDYYLRISHIITMFKIKAKIKLKNTQ